MNSKKVKYILILLALSMGILISSFSCITINQQPQQSTQQPPPANISPPVIEYFEAKPPEIAFGSSCTLIWKVTGAESIEISPDIGSVNSNGEVSIMPSQRMVYTLVATNQGISNTATAIVVVNKNLKAKTIALTEEEVMPYGFVYDSSSEPHADETISTYHVLFTQGPYSNTILDNTVYIFNTVPDTEAVFADDKYNSRMYATDFVAIGTEGYILTINSSDISIPPTYSLKFYKNNVYVKLTGNIPFNVLENLGRIIESRIY
jgi:hypothetical protein